MPGSTGAGLGAEDRAVVEEVGRRYDSNHHLDNTAEHTGEFGNINTLTMINFRQR